MAWDLDTLKKASILDPVCSIDVGAATTSHELRRRKQKQRGDDDDDGCDVRHDHDHGDECDVGNHVDSELRLDLASLDMTEDALDRADEDCLESAAADVYRNVDADAGIAIAIAHERMEAMALLNSGDVNMFELAHYLDGDDNVDQEAAVVSATLTAALLHGTDGTEQTSPDAGICTAVWPWSLHDTFKTILHTVKEGLNQTAQAHTPNYSRCEVTCEVDVMCVMQKCLEAKHMLRTHRQSASSTNLSARLKCRATWLLSRSQKSMAALKGICDGFTGIPQHMGAMCTLKCGLGSI